MIARARARSVAETPAELICCEAQAESIDRNFAGRILMVDTEDTKIPLMAVCRICKRGMRYRMIRVVNDGYVPIDAIDIDEGACEAEVEQGISAEA